MLYRKYVFSLVMVLLSSSSLASNEDWYVMVGLGKSDVSNDTDLRNSIESIKSSSGADEFSLGMDLIGVYRPHTTKQELLWGLAVHSDAQFLSNSSGGNLDISILNYTMALSYMYFPSREHGRGIYLRGDAGLVRNMVIIDGSDDIDEKLGAGVLLGMGYGLPISSDTRVLVGANYSVSFVRGGDYKALSLMITGMW